MPLTTAGKNRALDAWAGTASGSPVTHAALHSGIPGDAGSNEISGGSPAYARKAVDWASASSGSVSKGATSPTFDVPAGTVMFVGWWTGVSGGTCMGWAPANAGGTRGAATMLASSDVATCYAHGLSTNDQVILSAVGPTALPSPLDAATVYFVVNAATDTFQLALTQGGSAINATTSSEFLFQKLIPEVFGSQGTFQYNAATVTLNG